MTQSKAAESIAKGAGINLSLAISDDVLPTRILKNDEKDIPNAITFEDLLDKNGKPNLAIIKSLLPLELVFLGDKKKLSKITFQSCVTSSGVVMGAFRDKDRKEPVFYPIVKPKERFVITKESDKDFGKLLAAFSEPSVYGSINTKYPVLFKIVSVEKEKTAKKGQADLFLRATQIVANLTENQALNLGLVIGLPMWRQLDPSDRIIALSDLAKENPQAIVDAAQNDDNEYILLFAAAKDSRIIVEKGGIYKFRNFDLGVDVKGVVSYLKMNENVFELIKSELGE